MMAIRILFAMLGASVLFTACQIGWAFYTPGDYFANGSGWVGPTELITSALGFVIAYHVRKRVIRICLVAMSLASLAYWVFVPMGWWAKGPPM